MDDCVMHSRSEGRKCKNVQIFFQNSSVVYTDIWLREIVCGSMTYLWAWDIPRISCFLDHRIEAFETARRQLNLSNYCRGSGGDRTVAYRSVYYFMIENYCSIYCDETGIKNLYGYRYYSRLVGYYSLKSSNRDWFWGSHVKGQNESIVGAVCVGKDRKLSII